MKRLAMLLALSLFFAPSFSMIRPSTVIERKKLPNGLIVFTSILSSGSFRFECTRNQLNEFRGLESWVRLNDGKQEVYYSCEMDSDIAESIWRTYCDKFSCAKNGKKISKRSH